MLPLYIHRTSPVHRLPAAAKLAVSLVAGGMLFFVGETWLLVSIFAVVCAFYPMAELPTRTIIRALRPVLVISVIIFAVQLFLAGPEEAVRVVLRLMTLILLTSLVTLTTRFSDMLATLTSASRPFAALGLNPPKFALAAALVIRFIPTLLSDLAEIRQARLARGSRGLRSFGPGPLIIKILRMTDALAAAIAARGFESRN
jgi:biotin transport system permease protein